MICLRVPHEFLDTLRPQPIFTGTIVGEVLESPELHTVGGQ